MSIGSVRNPLHVIIDFLILYERALVGGHQASTDEARREALEEWRRCHPAVWGRSTSRNDTIRTLADPAKAWLTRANSPYVEVQDFNLVEECVHALSAFAISPSPMAMPDVYSKRYNPEEELWQMWTEQGEKILALGNMIARLKELGARAGEVWTPAPHLQQWRSATCNANRTSGQRTPPQDPTMPSGQVDRTPADQPARDDEKGGEMSKDPTGEYLVKVGDLKGMLNDRSRNGSPSEQEYAKLRAELIAIPPIRDALPNFVLKNRTIEEFWQFIKAKYKTWRERTEFLRQEFEPILSWLEGGTTPAKRNPTGRAPEVIKVLLLSANPIDSPLNIDEEFRSIDQKIRSSEHRDHVNLIKHGGVRLEDVASLLMRHKPHIVHFSGHGAASGIALTGADGKGHLVPPDALANIFRTLKDNIRVVLLNACDSAPQAEAIVREIDCAVGMSDEIEDQAAIAFAAAFYEALGYGRSVQTAFDLALVQLTGAGADRTLARLYKRRGVKPSEIVLVNLTP